MSAVVYGGRSPIALELCRQLADTGHEVHLVTRVRDESIVNLGRENGCAEIHECDLETLDKSIALANGSGTCRPSIKYNANKKARTSSFFRLLTYSIRSKIGVELL